MLSNKDFASTLSFISLKQLVSLTFKSILQIISLDYQVNGRPYQRFC